ncbi:hypothetical protein LTR27_005292 [Elasticomyces elasticus]|nr:hypothetical protein LTR27_005292 [Elasticomyces elasticus]
MAPAVMLAYIFLTLLSILLPTSSASYTSNRTKSINPRWSVDPHTGNKAPIYFCYADGKAVTHLPVLVEEGFSKWRSAMGGTSLDFLPEPRCNDVRECRCSYTSAADTLQIIAITQGSDFATVGYSARIVTPRCPNEDYAERYIPVALGYLNGDAVPDKKGWEYYGAVDTDSLMIYGSYGNAEDYDADFPTGAVLIGLNGNTEFQINQGGNSDPAYATTSENDRARIRFLYDTGLNG